MEFEEYIAAHIDAEPDHLRRLYRRTNLTRLYPRMCSGHAQGRLLVMLTRMINPQRILELGTFTGYSALCFAEGSGAEALIDTVEVDDEYADDLRELFADSPGGEKIRLHIGDAEEYLEGYEGEKYDLIFIDANKRRYTAYFEGSLRVLRSGGYILADNTLWSSKVAENASEGAHDAQTEGIRLFNEHVAADPRVEKVILPIRDGLTIIRKK
ncbi:MAG: O-methyltransferase [Muribaculaceae bacterium]|nr:O-methyltransferase [Muribaculaceae bacterium]